MINSKKLLSFPLLKIVNNAYQKLTDNNSVIEYQNLVNHYITSVFPKETELLKNSGIFDDTEILLICNMMVELKGSSHFLDLLTDILRIRDKIENKLTLDYGVNEIIPSLDIEIKDTADESLLTALENIFWLTNKYMLLSRVDIGVNGVEIKIEVDFTEEEKFPVFWDIDTYKLHDSIEGWDT